MAGKKMHSAKTRRFINNSIVHVILAVLAAIWVFPIIWVILTSFRAEKGSYVSTFLPADFRRNTGENIRPLPVRIQRFTGMGSILPGFAICRIWE